MNRRTLYIAILICENPGFLYQVKVNELSNVKALSVLMEFLTFDPT